MKGVGFQISLARDTFNKVNISTQFNVVKDKLLIIILYDFASKL